MILALPHLEVRNGKPCYIFGKKKNNEKQEGRQIPEPERNQEIMMDQIPFLKREETRKKTRNETKRISAGTRPGIRRK